MPIFFPVAGRRPAVRSFVLTAILISSALALALPARAEAATIRGAAVEGVTLRSGTVGTSYRWLRCNVPLSFCSVASTRAVYTIPATAVGARMRLSVTRSRVTSVSIATARVLPRLPVAAVKPTITGSPRPGIALGSTRGTWTPTVRSHTYAYQWLRCTPTGSCFGIAGATTATYVPHPTADPGRTLQLRIIATARINGMTRAATAYSARTAVVPAPAAPANVLPPTITGAAVETTTLQATQGAWSGPGPITYTRTWRSCDFGTLACSDIAGQVTESYVPTELDRGQRLIHVVTATNPWGSSSVATTPTAAVAAAEPAAASPPTIAGSALYAGGSVTASTGSWTGLGSISYAFQWQRCDALGDSCGDIPEATSATHSVSEADAGGTLRVAVTGTNTVGAGRSTSAPTAVVGASAAPEPRTPPTISGTLMDGSLLAASRGTFVGAEPMTRSWQWLQCDANGRACLPINGATASTYRPASSDVHMTLRVADRATNGAGTELTQSSATGAIALRPLALATAPTLLGPAPVDGGYLRQDDGSWTGTPNITYQRQWRRCNAAGSACSDIPGETATLYRLSSVDVGLRVRVRITATNPHGSLSAESAPSAPVAPRAPAGVAPYPTITGTFATGQQLTTSPGTWAGEPTSFAYAWLRCDGGGGACVTITGATTATYTTTPADLGRTIRARVTGTNAVGVASVQSSPTVSIVETVLAPAPGTPPAIRPGTATRGRQLEAVVGTFSGTPSIAHSLTWQRCDGTDGPGSIGENCVDLAGETGSTYLLTETDVGRTLRVRDSASNSAGVAQATSNPSAVVAQAYAPALTAAPAIDGVMEEGATLTADPGTWTGTGPITYSYAWQRCDLDGSACQSVPSAAGTRYVLTAADVNFAVKLYVGASSPYGSEGAQTDVSSEVAPARIPVNSGTAPNLLGSPEETKSLTVQRGTWTGTTMTFTYQWQRCDAVGASCATLPGATGLSYSLGAADVGRTMRVRVSAANPAAPGGVTAVTPATAVVFAATPPVLVSENDPRLEYQSNDGAYRVHPGTWTGTSTITFSYQWQRCTTAEPESCSNIGTRQSSAVRALVAGDLDHWLRAIVHARNPVAATDALAVASPPTAIHGPIVPASTPQASAEDPPSIIGEALETRTLTGDQGTWVGGGAVTLRNEWLRCDSSGAACAAIPNRTTLSLLLVAADVGSTIRLRVTASNSLGSAVAVSDPSEVVQDAVAPSVVTLPTLTSNDTVAGTLVTAGLGTWDGTPTISYARRWQRCAADGTSCVDIAGQTGTTYRLTSSDVGGSVRALVIATNPIGSAPVQTTPLVVSPADPPSSTAPPVVSNQSEPSQGPVVGNVMTVSTGSWSGTAPFTYSYQWQRCDQEGLACGAIDGATRSTYPLVGADLGGTVRALVTAANASTQTAVEVTVASAVVGAATLPDATSPPTVADAPERTQSTSSSRGSWTGSKAITYAYQWQRCTLPDPGSCSDITGATNLGYVPLGLDVERFLRIVVTATNGAGSVSAASSLSAAPVSDGTPPTNVTSPSVVGAQIVGNTVTADPGTWSGTGTETFSYQWQRCTASGGSCNDIPGHAAASYVLTGSDAGATIRVQVVGHNVIGVSDPVASAAVGPIT